MAKNSEKKLRRQADALEKQIAGVETGTEKRLEALQAKLDTVYEQIEAFDDADDAKRKEARAQMIRLASKVLRKLEDKDATALANAIEVLM